MGIAPLRTRAFQSSTSRPRDINQWGWESREHGAGSKGETARSKEHGARSKGLRGNSAPDIGLRTMGKFITTFSCVRELGAGSGEQGAWSTEQGAAKPEVRRQRSEISGRTSEMQRLAISLGDRIPTRKSSCERMRDGDEIACTISAECLPSRFGTNKSRSFF